MIRLAYDPELVEEAVLLSERVTPRAEARAFRRERDRAYEIADPEQREASFRSVHLRWFVRLALHHIVEELVAERVDIALRMSEGRVLRALTRREEGADLVDQVAPGAVDPRPILVLRLRPATLFEPEGLRALLGHELMHVADMLDPAFGYERSLPNSDDGPPVDNILRDRYRVLWDVTIDGRLTRALHDRCGVQPQPDRPDPTREARWQEFAATFSMLGDGCQEAFDEWFTRVEPTHARLLAFAREPGTGFAIAAARAG